MKNDPNQQLQDALLKLRAFYQELHSSLQSMLQDKLRVVNPSEVHGILESVQTNQQIYESILKHWNLPGFTPSSRSDELRIEAAEALAQILQQVEELERRTQQAKGEIIPQLSHAALDRQAAAAYGRNSS